MKRSIKHAPHQRMDWKGDGTDGEGEADCIN